MVVTVNLTLLPTHIFISVYRDKDLSNNLLPTKKRFWAKTIFLIILADRREKNLETRCQ